MKSCKELVERHAEAALASYGRDKVLAPALHLLDREQGLSCSILPKLNLENGGMPGVMRATIPMLGTIFETHWLLIVSETWVQRALDEAEANQRRKGDLEKAALAGDQTVHTGLLICAYDLFDIDASHSLTYDVDESYRRHDMPGVGVGDMADSVRWISESLVRILADRPEGHVPMYLIQTVLNRLIDYIEAAAVNPAAVRDE